jgi:hypothetical protein
MLKTSMQKELFRSLSLMPPARHQAALVAQQRRQNEYFVHECLSAIELLVVGIEETFGKKYFVPRQDWTEGFYLENEMKEGLCFKLCMGKGDGCNECYADWSA